MPGVDYQLSVDMVEFRIVIARVLVGHLVRLGLERG